MPVYVRKNLMSITPDSLSTRSSDEEDYITDPDQMIDYLPQPFRLVNKIVTSVFDAAWDRVGHRERIAEELRSKVPVPEYDNAEVVDEYKDSPSMVSSPDGTAMFVGLPNDIQVIHPITNNPIASWKSEEGKEETTDEKSQILSIETVQIGVKTCLLVTVDNSGCCRMFIYSSPFLLFVKDYDGEFPQGSKVIQSSASEDGDYIIITIEGEQGDVWLDVYKLPKDNWIRDVDNVRAEHAKQHQEVKGGIDQPTAETSVDTLDGGIEASHPSEGITGISKNSSRVPTPVMSSVSTPSNWNPANLAKPTQVLRVRSPTTSVNGVTNPIQPGLCNPSLDEWISTIGLGNRHQLTENHLQQRRTAAKLALGPYTDHVQEDQEKMKEEKRSKKCRCIFVSPGIALSQGAPLNILSHGISHFLVCAWEDTNNLCFYNLLKTAKDLEHKPDKIMPFASTISSVSLSGCGMILGVGLESGCIILIDHHLGTPLAVENMSTSSITYLDFPVFGPTSSPSTAPEKLQSLTDGQGIVLVGTTAGGLYSLTVNYDDKKTSCCCLQKESRKDEEKLGTIYTIAALKNVVLVMNTSGSLTMFNFVTGQMMCRIKVPPPYIIEKKDMEHAISLAANGQKLFLKGTKQEEGEDEKNNSNSLTALLAFQFQSFDCLDTSWRSVSDQEISPPTLMHTTMAKQRVDLLMSSHLLESQERQLQIQRRWSQLKLEAQQR